jgi:hypothetical protein
VQSAFADPQGTQDDVEVLIKEKKLYALESKNAREKGRMLFRKQQLGKSPEDDQVLDQVADTNKLKNMWNMFEPQIKECKNLVSLAKNLKQVRRRVLNAPAVPY